MLCQLYLKLAFAGPGTSGENIQNQCSTVDNLYAKALLQVSLLQWRELVVEDSNIIASSFLQRLKLGKLSFAHIVRVSLPTTRAPAVPARCASSSRESSVDTVLTPDL